MELPSFAPPSKPPYLFTPKPKVLYVADVPEWSFDRKGKDYRKTMTQFDIDIGYANPLVYEKGMGHLFFREMEKQKHYDVIWHLHECFIPDDNEIGPYVAEHNKNGTLVLCTINQLYSKEMIEHKKQRLSFFNALSVNNPYCLFNLRECGFDPFYTPDGYPGDIYGPDVLIENRPFNVLFVSSNLWLQHKGYAIWCEVRDALEPHGIGFIEIVANSFNNQRSFEQMNEIYNRCQVYCCMSLSEGGPCTLQESAACGVVPICTKVGYTEYLKNIFIVDRNRDDFIDKILYLYSNPDVLDRMSRGIVREAYHWQSSIVAKKWAHFVEQCLIRKKGIYLK